MLTFSNAPGQAYYIETCTKLGVQAWERRAAITGEAKQIAWADDHHDDGQKYYRVSLASNAAPFLSLQDALRRACTNQGIVGATAAAFIPQHGLWLGTFGTSDGKLPIRPHTPFEIGSITKSFVATTILRLVEEGRLSLEDTVGRWLPTLNCANVSSEITLRQLLNHRAGVYNFGDDLPFRQALFSDWSRQWQPTDVMKYVSAPYFAPDTDGQYSNTGYVLLGMVIESATGRTLAEEMRRTVLTRADLRSTWMGANEPWLRPLANPHLDFDGDGIHEDLGALSQTAILTSFWTSGAEISTADDVLRFAQALFTGALINDTSLTEMRVFRPIDIGGVRYNYGLGMISINILGREHWAHSGGLFGEFAWMSYCPSTGMYLAVAYNYPPVKTGPSLPGELLITLSYMAQSQPAALAPLSGSPRMIQLPFLNTEVPE